MMRYDPSKRPSASECLQHPYFQVRLPIPLSAAANSEEEDTKTKPAVATTGAEELPPQTRDSMEEFSPKNMLARGDENIGKPRRIKITSKELMQNARYKPGVKPWTLRSKNAT